MIDEKQIQLNSVIIINPEIIFNIIDGEVVIMSIAKNNFYGIDEIGSHIWELLKKPKSVEEIITIMEQNYEVDRTTCQKDVIEFLEEILAQGLIICDPEL